MAEHKRSTGRLVATLFAFGLAACQAESLLAGAFTVSPVQVVLSGRRMSAMVRVVNESADVARLQVTAFAWEQAPDGEMRLSPTEDLVFFPALFELAAGGDRSVRIGVTAAAQGVERSYRVFFEELPAPASESTAPTVRMLLRMGVPVFVEPAGPRRTSAIAGVTLAASELSWTVRNTGNAHFTLEHVTVEGLDDNSAQVFRRQFEGWYVLAGGERAFGLKLGDDECRSARRVRITAATDAGGAEATIEVPAGACTTATP